MKISKLFLLGMLLVALCATAPIMAAQIGMAKETEIQIGDPDHPVDVYWIGQTIHYTLEVENTSSTQSMVIDISDIEPGGTPTVLLEDNITLSPGETWNSDYDYVVAAGDVVPHPIIPGVNIVINTLLATGLQGGIEVVNVNVTKTVQAVNPVIHIEKATNGADADDPTGPLIPVGGAVTWTYVVTNTGDVPLTGIVVTDDQGGVTPAYVSGDDGDNILQVTETWIYQATGTAAAGQYANIGTATGHYYGRTVNDTDPSHYFGANPVIHIEKATNGDDADLPTGPEISVGGAVTWTYVVTNPGNVPLTGIVVTDDQVGVTPAYVSGDDGDNILQVTETWIYQASGTAVEGQYANIGTATGHYDDTTVNDTDPSHYIGTLDNPGIDIEKATNGEDADGPYGPFIMVGDTVTWTYVVTNTGTGDVPLTSVVVIDDNGTPLDDTDDIYPTYISGDGGVIGVLEVGEIWLYEATGTAAAGQYENIACVDALYEQESVGDCDPSHYYGVVCYSETAFGLNDSLSPACLIDLDHKANIWGWTHGPIAAGGTYTFGLWAGAAHCETDNGTYAGTVTIHYTGAGADITYNLEPDFEIVEEHVYIGSTELPQVTKGKKTVPTVAPGQYYITNGLTGNIYIIYHCVVEWCDYPVELVQ